MPQLVQASTDHGKVSSLRGGLAAHAAESDLRLLKRVIGANARFVAFGPGHFLTVVSYLAGSLAHLRTATSTSTGIGGYSYSFMMKYLHWHCP